MKKKTTYEQPLNDRVKNLLRLEHLFSGLTYHFKGPTAWDNDVVVLTLIEILDCLERFNFKIELVKEIGRYAQELERWQNTPKSDTQLIGQLLNRCHSVLDTFVDIDVQIEEKLKQHHLINVVKQRRTIAGGTCRGDVPVYHYWLQKMSKQRQTDLNEWLMSLDTIRNAVELNLYMIRNHATVSQELAVGGLFQSKLEPNIAYQLIQVNLPIDHACYPEINGGKHRFTIRFFEHPVPAERPLQANHDVTFELSCCMA